MSNVARLQLKGFVFVEVAKLTNGVLKILLLTLITP